MDNQLGRTIRILRQAKSLKVTDVARTSGVSVPFLSLVENGEQQPSLDVVRRIANALGIPSEALVVMGMGGSLKTRDRRASALADTVGRLIEMEGRLKHLLGKESRREAKPNPARRSR